MLSRVRLFATPCTGASQAPPSMGFSRQECWSELPFTSPIILVRSCLITVVLEKTLESPLDCKEIQPVHPKGNQSWIFIGRTDAKTETPILWPPDVKNWLIWKDPDAGKDWRWEEKRMTEDEMVGWHHWLNRHEFELVTKSRTRLSNWTEQDTWDWIVYKQYIFISHSFRGWKSVIWGPAWSGENSLSACRLLIVSSDGGRS